MKTIFTKNSIFSLFLILGSLFLNAQPSSSWISHYNGTNNLSDKAIAVEIDNNCNIYVVGQSDSLGTGSNYITIKYDRDGNMIWRAIYDGPAHMNDIPTAIKVDASGNVYVTGKSATLTNGFDFLTVKYNATGVQQWASSYNSTSNSDDIANDLAVDASGNVYVCGNRGSGSAMIKYNSAGSQQWASSNMPSGIYKIRHYKVKIANSGAIEVLGDNYNPDNGYGGGANEIRLYHYNATTGVNGFTYWGLGYGPYNPQPVDFVLNSAGVAFVSTYCNESGNENIYILSSSDTYSTFASYNPTGTGNSRPSGIKLDNSGNIYMSGYTDIDANSTVNYNYIAIKYNSSGIQQWKQTYGGTSDDKGIDFALGSGSTPDIYITGYTTNAQGNKDITSIKYNNNGTLQSAWSQTYNGATNEDDLPLGLKVDAYNNILLTGYSGALNGEDFTTIKYQNNSFTPVVTQSGYNTYIVTAGTAYQWYFNADPIVGATQRTLDISATGNGSYYCLVKQYCSTYTSNTILGYVGIQDLPNSASTFVFPNPNTGNFAINYQLPEKHEGTLEIFNTAGSCIYKMKLPKSSSTQQIKLSNIEDGIYNCIISSDSFRISRKIAVIK